MTSIGKENTRKHKQSETDRQTETDRDRERHSTYGFKRKQQPQQKKYIFSPAGNLTTFGLTFSPVQGRTEELQGMVIFIARI